MGKQRKHRQAQTQAQAEKGEQVNPGGDRVIKLLDEIRQPATTSVASTAVQDRPASTLATVQPPAAPIAAVTTSPATTAPVADPKPQFPRGERKPGDTIAGQTKYDRFFAIVAKAVREGKISGFRPLGFIPGPAVIVEIETSKIRIIAGTPEETQRLGSVPTESMDWNALPEDIRKPLEAYQIAVAEMDHSPSSYHLGFAKKLLVGKLPAAALCMLMSNFRYKAGDPERPFGIVLVPAENGMKIAKIYNPANVPDVPAEGTVLPLDLLKNGFGAIQKLLRTWALMEDNFFMRFDEKGNRLANGGYRPPQQRQQPVAVAQ